jgi:hypothetical protein
MRTKMLRLDQRVRVKESGLVGFVSKIEGERITVRIPSNTDWPYPSYIYTHKHLIKRVAASRVDSLSDIEEALF